MKDEQPPVDIQQSLERRARRQVPGPVTHEQKGTSGNVNIWSGRQQGPRQDRKTERKQQPSGYRCKPKLDTGKTKGSQGNVNTFCTFFAKGMCYQGPDCPYLHRLPTSADNAAMARNTGTDIFGREKMPAGMENKKGAGSYELDMTTLYVNYGGARHYAVPQLRHLLLQNFGEWGPVKRIHIVPTKTIAFIKYHWRVSAEFAREAMDQQQLTGSTLNEVLSVRWAYDDPNPVAVIGRKRQALDAVEAAAVSAWDALPPDEKRARIAMAQQARAQRVSAVAAAMPEPLLAASSTGDVIADDSFDAYRGFSSKQQGEGGLQGASTGMAGAPSAVEHPGQEEEQQQWEAASDPQAVAAAWEAYYAQCAAQDEQQQAFEQSGAAGTGQAVEPGTWFQGWRQRHKPETFAISNKPVAAGSDTTAGDQAGAEGASGGGLGLLAGYGSDSDSEGAAAGDDPAHQ